MTQSQGNKKDGWIYPTLSQSQNKQFFVWSDLDFNDTSTTRKLINEENVAVVHLKRTDSQLHYDHVPLDPKMLPDTPNQKYLLYCLGSSNQRTQEGINQMIIASFKMLNEIEKELLERKFQVWIVANPAAYQPNRKPKNFNTDKYNRKESVMFDYLEKLNNSFSVFDWYGFILENVTENFKTIHNAKRFYYDFQKLILFRILHIISGIEILRPEIVNKTPMPNIKESFFLILSAAAEIQITNAITTESSKQNDFKTFYDEQKEAYEQECIDQDKNNELKLPNTVVLVDDDTVITTIYARNVFKSSSEKMIDIQGTYKDLKVAIKVVDARRFDGDVTKLQNELMDIKHDFISPILGIGTDKENFNIFYILTEYSEQKLFHAIQIGRPKKDLFLKWIKNIADALIYLHENNILHCNITSYNIVIDKNDTAKICEIDSILRMNSSNTRLPPYFVECPSHYVAPELMKDKLFDSRIDVWSYSQVVLELVVGLLTPHFCIGLVEGKYESLDKVLTFVPQSLQTMLRAGLKLKRTDRVFMKDLVPLLNDVKNELDSMTEETWQVYAQNNFVKKQNYNAGYYKDYKAELLDINVTRNIIDERRFILEKLEKGKKHREKLTNTTSSKKVDEKLIDIESKLPDLTIFVLNFMKNMKATIAEHLRFSFSILKSDEAFSKSYEHEFNDEDTIQDPTEHLIVMHKILDERKFILKKFEKGMEYRIKKLKDDRNKKKRLADIEKSIKKIKLTLPNIFYCINNFFKKIPATVAELLKVLPRRITSVYAFMKKLQSGPILLPRKFAKEFSKDPRSALKLDQEDIYGESAKEFASRMTSYIFGSDENDSDKIELSQLKMENDNTDRSFYVLANDQSEWKKSSSNVHSLDQEDGENLLTNRILDERFFILKRFEKVKEYREKKLKNASDKKERLADIKKQMTDIYKNLPALSFLDEIND